MKIICLTGGIASGKSTASAILRGLGANIIDADKLGHQTYQKGTSSYKKLISIFGESIRKENGEIDRDRLGKIVFADKKALKKLTDVVWPEIEALARKKIKEICLLNQDSIIVFEAAVLFEAGWDKLGDETWVIEVDRKIAEKRLMKRNKLNRDDALKRLKSQTDNKSQEGRVHFFIKNNSSEETFHRRVVAAWNLRT